MQNLATAQRRIIEPRAGKRAAGKKATRGPSLFEVEYLQQMKAEWEAYMRTKGFSTILSFELVFNGADYQGSMKVTA